MRSYAIRFQFHDNCTLIIIISQYRGHIRLAVFLVIDMIFVQLSLQWQLEVP